MNSTTATDFPARPVTVVLCGVGGQGTITAADLLARAALAEGYDVKVSEIHGMAQRGGSVSTTVRFGAQVSSMVCDPGQADVLLSFELVEAVRNLPLLAPDGLAVVNDVSILPMSVLSGAAEMPAPERLHAALAALGADRTALVDADRIAQEAGNRRCANVALLGAAACRLPIAEASWQAAIEGRVPPKTLEANLRAFAAGRACRAAEA